MNWYCKIDLSEKIEADFDEPTEISTEKDEE